MTELITIFVFSLLFLLEGGGEVKLGIAFLKKDLIDGMER